MSEAEQVAPAATTEDGDGILCVRGSRTHRGWNGIRYKTGLAARNVGSRELSMNVATVPPGGVAYAHTHVDFEVMLFILQGRVRHEYGEGLEKAMDNQAGDFIFIEPGVPHEVINLSDTEPVIAVVARSDASEWANIVDYPSKRRPTEVNRGRVEAIWTKRAKRGPMDRADRARLVANEGIEGDANFGRAKRQVTVIEKEVFDRVSGKLADADPAMRRANIMVSGVRLQGAHDHVLSLGDVRIRLVGETRPCERLDDQCPGLTDALDAHWGGGAYGVVLDDGEISVGDAATLSEPAEP